MTNTVALAWDQYWQGARCRGDTDTFFLPDRKLSSHEKAKRIYRAKQICKECPLKQQCLKWALDHRIAEGVWGGVSEQDRMRLLEFRKDRPKLVGTRSR
jgi:WhiB family redox-sensing transcriptional regulator